MIKSLEESNLLIKDLGETIKNETKIQEGGLLGMLLDTLAATILEKSKIPGRGVIRAGEGVI